ncbi:hypothetical protein Q4E93_29335 [Flavitalea sp. BT771]|uniref:hypothetical protein n=1 Tax=Flavitalea sp. BT771 TaxID=3063329 RepID=UPI0026E1C94E|nr:hypothetical protein [Flavitalea sp. BT771]MDO6434751.1 hypothetical protein [Flavitalea sp. BT771]MDV6223651.1 hypothetical protein [Flavitalea sp. BT771]
MINILLIAFLITQNCRDKYLDRVLESESSAKFFLVVKVNIDKKEKEVLVLNDDLHNVMKSKDSVYNNMGKYKYYVKNMIEQKGAIDLDSGELVRMNAVVLQEDRKVVAAAARGKKAFFNHYFYVSKKYNYARLNPHLKQKERLAIMKKLFDWNFLIETVEGDFSVPELDFCGGV